MTWSPRLLPALILAAALSGAGAASAGDPEAMATAPTQTTDAPPVAVGAPPAVVPAPAPAAGATNVADQIDNYLKTSPALAPPKEGASGVISGDEPRKIHGTVDVAVGSNGYRSGFVQSELPLGKTGTLSIAVGETRFNARSAGRFGGFYAPGVRQTLGLGFYLGGEAAPDPRCRQMAADGPDPRFDPQFGGERLRPCRTTEAPASSQ